MSGVLQLLRSVARSVFPETETIGGAARPDVPGEFLAAGDVADVYLAREAGRVLKVSAAPEGNVFLDGERQTLASLLVAAGGTPYRKYLPALIESFRTDDGFRRRVNVFRYEPGHYTLEQVRERHPALDGRHLAWIFNRLLTVLGFVHQRGTVHGAVLPCHVLIHAADHGLQLVGWGQSVPAGRPVVAFPARYQNWYPPEVLRRRPASAATDLFLAARCLVYLAGGDPAAGRAPDSVPAPLRRFIDGCLLEGVRMRPDDAWKLQEEWEAVLRRVYGPPRFHELAMT
jgi:hypothetical protein